MYPTFIGGLQALVGLILLGFGSVPAMFIFVLVSGLFSGSAAISLPALGGSSIPPVDFALAFMFLRLMMPGSGQIQAVGRSFQLNAVLGAFVIYSVLMAYFGPRIFAGMIAVTPLKPVVGQHTASALLFAVEPLKPRSQNLTTSVYLVGTLLLAVSATVFARSRRDADTFVIAAVVLGTLHAVVGIVGALGADTVIGTALHFVRNGNYAQLDQNFNGFVRINGISPEPSSYATYALVWCVFLFECWFRNIRRFFTGPVALLLLMVLILSGSSSAYVGVAGYSVMFVIRSLLFPQSITAPKVLIAVVCGCMLFVAAGLVIAMHPQLGEKFARLLNAMTFGKASSSSGIQRAFWAKQGWLAFKATFGIGIGAGSFRSSSILAAILGCAGIVGLVSFLVYFWRVVAPLRLSTYVAVPETELAVAAAAGWAAAALVLVAAVNSPTCDPGPEFAVLAGCALGFRRLSDEASSLRAGSARSPLMTGGVLRSQSLKSSRSSY